jgi:hypothetical protein
MKTPTFSPKCLKCGIIVSTRRLAKHHGYCSRCWITKEIKALFGQKPSAKEKFGKYIQLDKKGCGKLTPTGWGEGDKCRCGKNNIFCKECEGKYEK